jgi:hypothetical protein
VIGKAGTASTVPAILLFATVEISAARHPARGHRHDRHTPQEAFRETRKIAV